MHLGKGEQLKKLLQMGLCSIATSFIQQILTEHPVCVQTL